MDRKKVIGYLAMAMVAAALFSVLCVTLQQGKEAGEARKIKQMESRVLSQPVAANDAAHVAAQTARR